MNILNVIDNINDVSIDTEEVVLSSLMESYTKALDVIESVDESSLDSFEIFNESFIMEAKKEEKESTFRPVVDKKTGKKENIIKSILMAIPRLLMLLIKKIGSLFSKDKTEKDEKNRKRIKNDKNKERTVGVFKYLSMSKEYAKKHPNSKTAKERKKIIAGIRNKTIAVGTLAAISAAGYCLYNSKRKGIPVDEEEFSALEESFGVIDGPSNDTPPVAQPDPTFHPEDFQFNNCDIITLDVKKIKDSHEKLISMFGKVSTIFEACKHENFQIYGGKKSELNRYKNDLMNGIDAISTEMEYYTESKFSYTDKTDISKDSEFMKDDGPFSTSYKSCKAAIDFATDTMVPGVEKQLELFKTMNKYIEDNNIDISRCDVMKTVLTKVEPSIVQKQIDIVGVIQEARNVTSSFQEAFEAAVR